MKTDNGKSVIDEHDDKEMHEIEPYDEDEDVRRNRDDWNDW